jgi:hypothetical protein
MDVEEIMEKGCGPDKFDSGVGTSDGLMSTRYSTFGLHYILGIS